MKNTQTEPFIFIKKSKEKIKKNHKNWKKIETIFKNSMSKKIAKSFQK